MQFSRSVVAEAARKKKPGGAQRAPPRFRHLQLRFELPGQLQAELHVAAPSIEKGLVQERRRGHENVAGIQGVGVIRCIDRAVIGWQADAEVGMVESVVGLKSELQRGTFRNFVRFEH